MEKRLQSNPNIQQSCKTVRRSRGDQNQLPSFVLFESAPPASAPRCCHLDRNGRWILKPCRRVDNHLSIGRAFRHEHVYPVKKVSRLLQIYKHMLVWIFTRLVAWLWVHTPALPHQQSNRQIELGAWSKQKRAWKSSSQLTSKNRPRVQSCLKSTNSCTARLPDLQNYNVVH